MEYHHKKLTWKGVWNVLKTAGKGFSDDRVTKLSGSLAYATLFSLAPFFALIIGIVGWIYGREAIEGQVFMQLQGIVGKEAAAQLQDVIKNVFIKDRSWIKVIVGAVTLVIGATAVFGEIQDSINIIWGIKAKPKKGWLKMFRNRFLSFSLIVSMGFLLLVSLGINSIIDGLNARLTTQFPETTVILFYVLNVLITFVVTAILFAMIFKVLPDAKIKWRDVLTGSFVTALLFFVGKFLISFYVSKSSINSTFGAAASVVILLVWIYYSAIILFFGAEFTKAWALEFGNKIYPNDYAVSTKIVEVESDKEAVEAINKKQVDEGAGDVS